MLSAFSGRPLVFATVGELVEIPLAAVVGAWMYEEENPLQFDAPPRMDTQTQETLFQP